MVSKFFSFPIVLGDVMDEEIGREQKAVKIYATRMVAARKMAGINQVNAAKMLGFSNSSNLSKIESGERQVIPLYIIIDAAKIYHTTTDYLLGLTDDWDDAIGSRMSERSAAWAMYELWERIRNRDVTAFYALDKRIRHIAENGGKLSNDVISLYFWIKSSGALENMSAITAAAIEAKIGGLYKAATSFRLSMDKLRLNKKDNVDQLAMSLISDGVD